jgi:hypothetical protein
MDHPVAWIAVPLVIFLATGTTAVLLARQSLRWRRVVRRGASARGRCLGPARTGFFAGSSGQTQHLRFAFTDDAGTPHEFVQHAPTVWRGGRTVTVHYHRADPGGTATVVVDARGMRAANVILIVVAGLFAVLALVFEAFVLLTI